MTAEKHSSAWRSRIVRPRLPKLRKPAIGFLAFALVCLVLLVALAAKVGNIALFSHRHTIYAQLADATGLTSGDSVKIAGVTVGQVSGISVQHGHALVSMGIDNNVVLHAGTDVGMQWRNVIGQKELYLYPSKVGPVLRPGSTIPLSHSVGDASVGALLNALGPFLSAINPAQANAFLVSVADALSGDTAQVDQLITNGAAVSNTLAGINSQVGSVIDDFDQVLSALSERRSDLGALVANLQTVSSSLASRNTLLDQVVSNLGTVSEELAQLESTNSANINGAVADLKSVAGEVVSHEKSLAKGLSTLGAGLAPYTIISSYGQWFQIVTVYTCLANETSCSYFEPSNPPAGTGPFGAPPSSSPAGAIAGGFAGSASSGGAAVSGAGLGISGSNGTGYGPGGSGASGIAGLGGILRAVAGGGGQ
ncbi:MAG: MCE family protein [Actinobacteria bacterium]|nr:MCE family protein [Actinomycetota bacterium]